MVPAYLEVKKLELPWLELVIRTNKVYDSDDSDSDSYPNEQIQFYFFSVYLIDDVLASLDAHVSKHIVKHCILDLLKDRTRIVVTENRTLYYYSNQILHVEKGMISTSDYSLGSFESGHLESTSSSSEDELNTPISFELNSDDSFIPDKSAFDVSKYH